MWLTDDPNKQVLPFRVNFQLAFIYSVPALQDKVTLNENLLLDDIDMFTLACREYVMTRKHQTIHSFWLTTDGEAPVLLYVTNLAGEICMRMCREYNLAALENRQPSLESAHELLDELCIDKPYDSEMCILSTDTMQLGALGANIHAQCKMLYTNLLSQKDAEPIMKQYFDSAIKHLKKVLKEAEVYAEGPFLGVETRRVTTNSTVDNKGLGTEQMQPHIKHNTVLRTTVKSGAQLVEILKPMYYKTFSFYEQNQEDLFYKIFGKCTELKSGDNLPCPNDFYDRCYAAAVAELKALGGGWKRFITLEFIAMVLCMKL
ncbi:ORF85-like protein [Bufonid herpesvirus 1]|uniref:ORF85-like protein n=1 Tax=Bufonid herpesvirus 1 TaxID=2282206 RepID=UPI000EB6166B|nr:ORF85-like protein [Bufonid herpesvirus 1]AXF48548.1 ORF85-like protein [Bufonid herpesvirus 1]